MHTDQWRTDIIDRAIGWLGTPYHHKGRKKGVGVDCGGLIYEVFSPLIPLKPFPKDYAPDWTLHHGEEIYQNFIGPYVQQIEAPIRGGLTLFKFGRCFGHGAIFDGSKYIHAWGRNGISKVIQSHPSFFQKRERQHFDVDPQWQ